MSDDRINFHLVYSTEHGSVCPGCSQPLNSCICQQSRKRFIPKGDCIVRLFYEVKGRKGKGMTLITGLSLNEIELLALAKKLKQQLGTGGSVKDYVIELQGDHRKFVGEELRKLGYILK